jgi:hypothetical protein
MRMAVLAVHTLPVAVLVEVGVVFIVPLLQETVEVQSLVLLLVVQMVLILLMVVLVVVLAIQLHTEVVILFMGVVAVEEVEMLLEVPQ